MNRALTMTTLRAIVLPVAFLLAGCMSQETATAEAMEMDAPTAPALMTDFVSDVETVRDKLIGLAEAIPEDTWDWRPGEGVRSVREVFMHVSADNYFLPAPMGIPAPESTGIQPDSFESVQAFEAQTLSKEATIEALTASFAHILSAMGAVDPATLGQDVSIFGRTFTHQGLWVLTTTHVHEHLGQMIAYARTNGVVPPWSM